MGFFEFLFGKQNETNNQADLKTQQSSASTLSSAASLNKNTSTPKSTAKPKKTIVTNSIDDIYGKGFRFIVDRYEEWANQKCISQDKLDGEIVAEVQGDKIVFTISGAERLDIVSTLSMSLSHPNSQVLRSKGNPLVQSDRIQYLANNVSGDNVPFLCHLFYENGRISYVRFAFMDPNSSALFPMTSRIYEFYGDMVELTGSSKTKASEKNEFTPFVFKSTCHQRYENLMPVRGLQQCLRTISVEKNINGCSGYLIKPGDGYIVKLFNNDTGQPNMSDKPMRVKSISNDLVVLQGYPLKAMAPFGWMDVDYSEYGLDVHYRNGEIEKCVLHMYERDTFIEYRK
ncbi:MAG: hypothetical protein K6F14_03715 [Clostridiales bacterium]|nr:hypothetical protein [Clostridiales bacterium]